MRKNKVSLLFKIIGVLFLASIIGGCFKKQNKVENEILKFSQECSENSKNQCILQISSLTDFDWDTMYYFSMDLPPADIREILGHKINLSGEICNTVVFINKGKIVHYEEWSANIEELMENQVLITNIDSSYVRFNSSQKFEVKKDSGALLLIPL